MDSRDLLPMGEISRRSGFAASAIRYYESEGLIEAHRSGGANGGSSATSCVVWPSSGPRPTSD